MRILNDNGFYLPVIRILKGKYLIGTDTKMISIRGEVAAVRVGGGWERLDLFIARVQDQEIEKLRRLVNDQKKKYKTVLIDLLTKYSADMSLI